MSKFTAAAYYAGIPPTNNNPEKPMILDYFCQGVRAAGDTAIAHRESTIVDCDVALIQGFVHDDGKNLPHLKLRKAAIDQQRLRGGRTLIVDSNLFLYADKSNSMHYLRYSFDGIFPTTGFYFNTEIDPIRWQKISKDFKIELKDYRTTGSHILICLQRNGGWSMGGVSVIDWMNATIREIQKYSNRPIVVRAHPGDKKIKKTLSIQHKGVRLSVNENLLTDLDDCWASVVYNSSPSIASIIQGVPTFVIDPIPNRSQSFEVANTDISRIESPACKERQLWIEKLCMSHWKFDEMRSGEAWQFFKKYI